MRARSDPQKCYNGVWIPLAMSWRRIAVVRWYELFPAGQECSPFLDY